MKRLSIVILAVLLALTTVLVSSCAAPPEENAGNGNNVGNGGTEDGTEASTQPPEETEPESTADEGTEKEEESALPEDSDSSNEDTSADVPPETEPVDEKYLEAIEALTVLDEETKNEIAEVMGLELMWIDYESLQFWSRYDIGACCYGEYNDCLVFLYRSLLDVEEKINIADYEFCEPKSFSLLAFYNGNIYSLEEAYAMGIVTNEDLESIIKNYETINLYCDE